jgi:hypothetical protein
MLPADAKHEPDHALNFQQLSVQWLTNSSSRSCSSSGIVVPAAAAAAARVVAHCCGVHCCQSLTARESATQCDLHTHSVCAQ